MEHDTKATALELGSKDETDTLLVRQDLIPPPSTLREQFPWVFVLYGNETPCVVSAE